VQAPAQRWARVHAIEGAVVGMAITRERQSYRLARPASITSGLRTPDGRAIAKP
jgi:hypothetical protein